MPGQTGLEVETVLPGAGVPVQGVAVVKVILPINPLGVNVGAAGAAAPAKLTLEPDVSTHPPAVFVYVPAATVLYLRLVASTARP